MRRILLPTLLLALGFGSCKKETEDLSEISQGHLFFPTEIGKYIVYNYDSTVWDDLNRLNPRTAGQVMYKTVDTFRDNANRLSYVINIEKRANDTDPFVQNDVLYVTPTSTGLEYSEKNITFLKLTFPVSEGKTWNGNSMIPNITPKYDEFFNEEWQYTYVDFDKDYDLGNKIFQHSVTVNHIDAGVNDPDVDSTGFAYKNYSQEVYAYNVGLIYRERIYWVYQPTVGFRKGYGVIMRAVEHN